MFVCFSSMFPSLSSLSLFAHFCAIRSSIPSVSLSDLAALYSSTRLLYPKRSFCSLLQYLYDAFYFFTILTLLVTPYVPVSKPLACYLSVISSFMNMYYTIKTLVLRVHVE
ncbi:hypothetical protein RO3G_09622 [Rhizopus delemar RA 99-880]|uniref:Uncharacterized protein n=1 Tax=Rhizopus delemar (strain RA 99-880 / ATCC MYA-4621 / FGSC 9543 / NRRL 43880) TaxID=246409 RepID=I1C8Y2_RHIO9|nr:hypothetical protein RO3G_09622 [Rhizopus delemar RA 99-880]|eukprot:EIE84912.1 hypothetical protein RO3G_09622 [Rhizopus delemar RA 99-880]